MAISKHWQCLLGRGKSSGLFMKVNITPKHFSEFILLLESVGFLVRWPKLPNYGDSSPYSNAYQDDVAVVRAVVQ